MTFIWTIEGEHIFVLELQQWLRERATVLHYLYVFCLITYNIKHADFAMLKCMNILL